MRSVSWIHEVTDGDIRNDSLPLTKAQASIPASARVTGRTPEIGSAQPEASPIRITWENGCRTEHFVQRGHRIANRTEAVREFYDRIEAKVGSARKQIVITAIRDGEYLITPLMSGQGA